MKWRERSFEWILLALTVFGGLLRFTSAGRVDHWRDEAQFIAIASLPTPSAIFRFLQAHESHPPLFYWIGHVIRTATGNVEAGTSLLLLLAATATVPLAGIVGRRLYSSGSAGLLAAAMIAGSAPLCLFSVQLRPYGLLSLLWLASAYAFVRMYTGSGRLWAMAWAATSVVSLWTHHASLLFFIAQLGLGAFLARRARERRGSVKLAVVAVGFLWSPVAFLLFKQLSSASYAAAAPMTFGTPWRQLAALLLAYPLEMLLPVLAAGLALCARGPKGRLSADGRHLVALAAGFILLATIATYRSHFLTPHLMLTVAPIGLVGVGGLIVAMHATHRLTCALAVEVVIVAAVLGFLFWGGVRKSNTREAAESLQRLAGSSDVVLLTPGFLGVSFGRYFSGPQLQIDFPRIGRLSPYPFDHHFERVSDTSALRVVIDSVDSALRSARAVWLVVPARWLRADADAPFVLDATAFRGLSQAERSRANFMSRYLEGRAGPGTLVVDGGPQPGMELVSLYRFHAPANQIP